MARNGSLFFFHSDHNEPSKTYFSTIHPWKLGDYTTQLNRDHNNPFPIIRIQFSKTHILAFLRFWPWPCWDGGCGNLSFEIKGWKGDLGDKKKVMAITSPGWDGFLKRQQRATWHPNARCKRRWGFLGTFHSDARWDFQSWENLWRKRCGREIHRRRGTWTKRTHSFLTWDKTGGFLVSLR